MKRLGSASAIGFFAGLICSAAALGQDAKPAPKSFMKDIAPIFVQNCTACHNSKKAESKYIMTSFAQLARGGKRSEGKAIEPGDPDASFLAESIRPDGEPRMPYKQDPLSPEQIATVETWIKEGAKYDGANSDEDWTLALRRLSPAAAPETYPVAMPITSLAYSPSGSEIAVSGYHEITIWSPEGTLLRRMGGMPERIYDIVYSPQGKSLAAAAGDPGRYGCVKLWIAEPSGGGKPIAELVETTDCMFSAAFSPDGKYLAAGGADRALRVWEVESGKQVFTIEDHADWILGVAFSPDGARIATASRDKTAKVFDLAKKESLVTFPNHGDTVYCVAFSPDGKLALTGGGDNRIRVWSPDNEGKQEREIAGFGGAVFRIKAAADGSKFAVCSMDKSVRVIDAKSWSIAKTLEGHSDWVYAVAISPDGKSLASGGWDGEVRVWNIEQGKTTSQFPAAPGLKRK